MLLLARLGKPRCCSPTTSPRLAHVTFCRNRLHTGNAHNVFDAMPAPDHRQCSALLRARTASGDHSGSASLLSAMLGRGLRPDKLALAAAVKSASALPDGGALGSCLHGFFVRAGYAAGVVVAKAVMDMYGKRGALADARLVFDEMSCPDAVCWNILITGSSRAGLFDDVFGLFRSMLWCGADESMPTAVTVAVIIPVYAKLRDSRAGRSLHGYVVKTGLESDTFCGNALVSMYAKCGGGSRITDDVHRAFSSIQCKDVVSWNSIIAGYSENGLFEEALTLFGQMISEKCLPNYSTVANIVPVCSFMEHGRYYGKEVHGFVFRSGLHMDVCVCNALMTHYSKVCEMRVVESIFRSMDLRDIVTWNTLIAGYVMNGYHSRVLDLFHRLLSTGMTPDSVSFISLLTACAQVGDVKGGTVIHGYIFRRPALRQETSLMNALTSFYSQCDRFDDALYSFADITDKDSVSWNAILSSCANRGQHIDEFVKLFGEMCRKVTRWDSVTVLTVVRMCTSCGIKMVRGAHGYSLRVGYISEISVANAILDAYAKCGHPQDADILFRNLQGRNIVTDNTMISCYLKNNSVEEAEIIFHQMSEKDQTTWNLMIQLYARNNMCHQAFGLFHQLQSPDTVSITNILLACIHLSLVQLVRQCHGYMLRASLEDIHLEGALLDAYSKCGNITNAFNIFQISPSKDIVTFTAMIGGYAMHGMAEEAVELFSEMLTLSIKPDHVALTALLSACSHAGLVDAGIKIFKFAREVCRVELTAEHYTCMVDLLARGGRLEDAYNIALDMPPHLVNANAWGSLLGACKVHGEVRIGQLAADQLFSMEVGDIGNYISVSNMYAADEKWAGVEQVRKLMKSKDVKKSAGCSQTLVYSQ